MGEPAHARGCYTLFGQRCSRMIHPCSSAASLPTLRAAR
jgi:hypothetical protein